MFGFFDTYSIIASEAFCASDSHAGINVNRFIRNTLALNTSCSNDASGKDARVNTSLIFHTLSELACEARSTVDQIAWILFVGNALAVLAASSFETGNSCTRSILRLIWNALSISACGVNWA
jgi:hypothetical protein